MELLRKHWPSILGGLDLLYHILRAVADAVGLVDTAVSHIPGQDQSWLGRLERMLLDPPGWFILITIFGGLLLILWDFRRNPRIVHRDRHHHHLQAETGRFTAGGGRGGSAKATGGGTAMGGPGGGAGIGIGGDGGNAEAQGFGSISVGGEGGSGPNADGTGGRGGRSGAQVYYDSLGQQIPEYLRGYGQGGHGGDASSAQRRNPFDELSARVAEVENKKKEAARLELANFRAEGVKLRNDADDAFYNTAEWQQWQKDIVSWNERVIETVKVINKADAIWFSILDVVPEARVLPDIPWENDAAEQLFNMHDFRLVKLEQLIHKYSPA